MAKTTRQTQMGQLITIGHAAKMLGVHPATLRNWDRSGKLVPLRHPVNGYRLYSMDELQQFSDVLTAISSRTGDRND